jgi:tRNA pseudouridine38-40 synthase
MIRNIVGALIYVGKGALEINQFFQIFLDKDRTKAPPTFMADGLYLSNIRYSNNIFSNYQGF